MDTDTLTLDEVDLILRMLAEWQGRADELLDRRLTLAGTGGISAASAAS